MSGSVGFAVSLIAPDGGGGDGRAGEGSRHVVQIGRYGR